jgi:hypothetical protein
VAATPSSPLLILNDASEVHLILDRLLTVGGSILVAPLLTLPYDILFLLAARRCGVGATRERERERG